MLIDGAAILVTGGSRGLGAALGGELARRGARVVLVARGAEALDKTLGAIRGAGGEAHGLVADVADPEGAYRIAGAAAALVGPIDVLVHNASELGPTPLRSLLDTQPSDFARVLGANLLGPHRLTRAVLGGMVVRGRGLVVHVTSDASTEAYPRWGAYGVSKAALDHLGRIWAAETVETGVRFLTVDPGEMRTAMHAAALPEADPATLADPADVARRIADLVAAVDTVPSGARVALSTWEQPSPAATRW
jgi:NAD(P)-dependent dehydrogenase (short-subunit alcohol dehydrogenase family)